MNLPTGLFDAHNHLQDAFLETHLSSVFTHLDRVGLKGCVVNGTCETDWPEVARLCAESRTGSRAFKLFPSFGLHPWNVGNRSPAWKENLLIHLNATPGSGVGEIGLDRWILDRARTDDPRLKGLRRAPLDEQIEVFRAQLILASERNFPTSIHCLDAFGALIDVLRSTPLPPRGFLLHAYSGSEELAVSLAKLGAFFSFNGAFLDPRKERLHALYRILPIERLLVETDAPAMPPSETTPFLNDISAPPHFSLPPSADGQRVNHPANIARAYAGLAALRGIDLPALSAQVAKNFTALFGRPS
jgi:TatD DNase family protein